MRDQSYRGHPRNDVQEEENIPRKWTLHLATQLEFLVGDDEFPHEPQRAAKR